MDRNSGAQSVLRAVPRYKDAQIFWTCFPEKQNKQMALANGNAKANK